MPTAFLTLNSHKILIQTTFEVLCEKKIDANKQPIRRFDDSDGFLFDSHVFDS